MLDRMHTQDLMAIITATIHGGTGHMFGDDHRGYQMQFYNQPKDSIHEAERLLAELDRTAPKAELDDSSGIHFWEDRVVLAEDRVTELINQFHNEQYNKMKELERADRAEARANALDRLTDEQNDAMKALEVKLETERIEGRIEGYRSALNDKTNGELAAVMAPGLAQATLAERERIITLLAVDSTVPLLVVRWDRTTGERGDELNRDELRAFLTQLDAK